MAAFLKKYDQIVHNMTEESDSEIEEGKSDMSCDGEEYSSP